MHEILSEIKNNESFSNSTTLAPAHPPLTAHLSLFLLNLREDKALVLAKIADKKKFNVKVQNLICQKLSKELDANDAAQQMTDANNPPFTRVPSGSLDLALSLIVIGKHEDQNI